MPLLRPVCYTCVEHTHFNVFLVLLIQTGHAPTRRRLENCFFGIHLSRPAVFVALRPLMFPNGVYFKTICSINECLRLNYISSFSAVGAEHHFFGGIIL